MRMTMSETVATSKEDIVRPIQLQKISPNYEDYFRDIRDDVLRFNFPEEYSIRLGFFHDINKVFLHKVEDTLIFSAFDMNVGRSICIKPFYYKHNGFHRTTKLSEYDDQQFFAIPRHFSPFEEDDNIVYKYVKEEDDIERHVICERQ